MSGNRKKDFKERVILCVFSLITIGIMCYSLATDERTLVTWLICGAFILGSVIYPTVEIIQYRKKYFGPEDKDNEAKKQRNSVAKRKKKLKKSIKGSDMYEVCSNFVAENNLSYAVLIAFLLGILSISLSISGAEGIYLMICSIMGARSEGGFALVPSLMVVVWYSLGPVLGGIVSYIYFRMNNKAVKMLKEMMARCNYDRVRVNDDFMIGPKHHLAQGLLHIGANYVVLCAKEASMVCEIHEVLKAKKRVEIVRKVKYGLEDEFRYYYITIWTADAIYEANCMDELAVDLILEDFANHGIFEERQ